MAGDIRRDGLILSREEAKQIVAGMWLERIDAAAAFLDSLKGKDAKALAALAKDPKFAGFSPVKDIADYANQSRPRTNAEVDLKLRSLAFEDDDENLYPLYGKSAKDLKALLDAGAQEIARNLEAGGVDEDDIDDEYIQSVREKIQTVISYAETPAPPAKIQKEIDDKISELQKSTLKDLSVLRGKSASQLAILAMDEDFELAENEQFLAIVEFANKPNFVTKEKIAAKIDDVKANFKKTQEASLDQRVNPTMQAIEGDTPTLGQVEAGMTKYVAGINIPIYQGGGLGKKRIKELLIDKVEHINPEIKAKREQQLADLMATSDPDKGLFAGLGGAASGFGTQVSELFGDGKGWVGEQWDDLNKWAEENPDQAFWTKVGGAGVGFLAAGMALKKIPVIGGVLAFIANVIGGIGALWGGLNLTLDFLGFKEKMGGSKAQEMVDPFNVITLEGSEAKVPFNKGQMLQETEQVLAKIKDKDSEMHKKLEAAKQELLKDNLSPEAKVQLGTVIRKINESSDVARTLEGMKTNGVATFNTAPMITDFLTKNPEVLLSSGVDTEKGKIISSESIDALMKALKENGKMKTYDTDPLGLGIKVNNEVAVRQALIEAVGAKAKEQNIEFYPNNQTGLTPKIRFITSQATETPAEERLAAAAAAYEAGDGNAEGLKGANGHMTDKSRSKDQVGVR